MSSLRFSSTCLTSSANWRWRSLRPMLSSSTSSLRPSASVWFWISIARSRALSNSSLRSSASRSASRSAALRPVLPRRPPLPPPGVNPSGASGISPGSVGVAVRTGSTLNLNVIGPAALNARLALASAPDSPCISTARAL